MARERLENGSVSNLNGTINDSVTTVAVGDAGLFSSVPQFRIIIDSEIMLVTAIAGNNLTVTRGAEGSIASAHTNGAVVAQIITREGIQRYHRDWSPAFDDSARSPFQLLDQSANTLEVANFTWQNQGGATAADMDSGGIIITAPTNATDSLRSLLRTAPSAPYIVTVAFIPMWRNLNDPQFGVIFRESGTGKISTMALSKGHSLVANNYTDDTTFSAAIRAAEEWSSPMGPVWLRIEDDNTDLNFSVSMDGIHFIEYTTQGRTAFMAGGPDEVGVYVNNLNSGDDAKVTLLAYLEV